MAVEVNGVSRSNAAESNVNSTDPVETQTEPITAEEIALYDRQIRLWGVKAQEKLRTSNILLINIKALANEIAKNLVLAGIGSLTIIDSEVVRDDDLGSQFFVSEEQIGLNRAEAAAPQIRKLNPRVSLHVDTENVLRKTPEFFAPFHVVIATDLSLHEFEAINSSCRRFKRPFYASGSHGFYGFIFADLISHEYIIERERSNVPTERKDETATRSIIDARTKKEHGKFTEIVTKREIYSPIDVASKSPIPQEHLSTRRRKMRISPLLTCLRALWEFEGVSGEPPSESRADLERFTKLATDKHKELQLPPETLRSDFLRCFLQNIGSELAPVTAFIGGQLAQDVINVLGQREQPIQNFLLFDGNDFTGPVYALHSMLSD